MGYKVGDVVLIERSYRGDYIPIIITKLDWSSQYYYEGKWSDGGSIVFNTSNVSGYADKFQTLRFYMRGIK